MFYQKFDQSKFFRTPLRWKIWWNLSTRPYKLHRFLPVCWWLCPAIPVSTSFILEPIWRKLYRWQLLIHEDSQLLSAEFDKFTEKIKKYSWLKSEIGKIVNTIHKSDMFFKSSVPIIVTGKMYFCFNMTTLAKMKFSQTVLLFL